MAATASTEIPRADGPKDGGRAGGRGRCRYRRSTTERAPRKRTFIAQMQKYLIALQLPSGPSDGSADPSQRGNWKQRWSVDAVSAGSVGLMLLMSFILPDLLAWLLLLAEAVFAVGVSPFRYRRFNVPFKATPTSLKQGLQLLTRMLDPAEGHSEALKTPTLSTLGWFVGVNSLAELGHSNVSKWLTYLLFGSSRPLDKAGMAETLSHHFISTLGLDVGQGHNPNAQFIAHTEEPLQASYRPLIFYLLTELVAAYGHMKLTGKGFKVAESTSSATYYVKEAAAGPANPLPPIVFLHGIGVGLAPYTAFLDRLSAKSGGRSIIAVTYKHVSMRLTNNIPTAVQVADDVARFLTQRSIAKVSMVAHSYGTLVASSFVKRHGLSLDGLKLIDPVCFAMFLPHLIRNTLYFHAGKKQHKATLFSWKNLMKGLVVRDLHCSAAMSRGFNWQDLNLWGSEIPANTTVVLSGGDTMIPIQAIQDMLASPAASAKQVELQVHPNRGHGGFLLDPKMQDDIIDAHGVAAVLPAHQSAADGPQMSLFHEGIRFSQPVQSVLHSHKYKYDNETSTTPLYLHLPLSPPSDKSARLPSSAKGRVYGWRARMDRGRGMDMDVERPPWQPRGQGNTSAYMHVRRFFDAAFHRTGRLVTIKPRLF